MHGMCIACASHVHGAFLSSQGPAIVAICGGATGATGKVGSDTMSQFLAEAVSQALIKSAEQFEVTGEGAPRDGLESRMCRDPEARDGASPHSPTPVPAPSLLRGRAPVASLFPAPPPLLAPTLGLSCRSAHRHAVRDGRHLLRL